MRRALLGLFALLVSACVTTSFQPPARPLPAGVYRHEVLVEIAGKDSQRFNGLLKILAGKLTMVLLSPFGTTMARVTDDLDRPNERVEIYADELKAYEDRIVSIYRDLKPALVDLDVAAVSVYGRELSVRHEGTIGPGLPRTTRIAGEGFSMSVEVTQYEKPAGT